MSVFNIEGFRSALTAGGARPNQFQVILNYPSYVGARDPRASSFLVTTAELPGSSVPPATVFYRGRQIHFAGDRVYAPWSVTVLNDADLVIRTALEQWMNGMDALQNKRGVTIPTSYIADLTVQQLDRNGLVSKTYILREAFPTEIGPVALDFSANDQISNFQVSFMYQYFVTNNVPAQGIV